MTWNRILQTWPITNLHREGDPVQIDAHPWPTLASWVTAWTPWLDASSLVVQGVVAYAVEVDLVGYTGTGGGGLIVQMKGSHYQQEIDQAPIAQATTPYYNGTAGGSYDNGNAWWWDTVYGTLWTQGSTNSYAKLPIYSSAGPVTTRRAYLFPAVSNTGAAVAPAGSGERIPFPYPRVAFWIKKSDSGTTTGTLNAITVYALGGWR